MVKQFQDFRQLWGGVKKVKWHGSVCIMVIVFRVGLLLLFAKKGRLGR